MAPHRNCYHITGQHSVSVQGALVPAKQHVVCEGSWQVDQFSERNWQSPHDTLTICTCVSCAYLELPSNGSLARSSSFFRVTLLKYHHTSTHAYPHTCLPHTHPHTHTPPHTCPPHIHPSPTPGTIECSGANLIEQAENCHFQRSTRDMCGPPAILILQGFNISEGNGEEICECAYRGGRYVCTTGE